MEAFTKVVRPGTLNTSGGRSYSLYVHIKYILDTNHNHMCLSITGVGGPLSSGNCLGGCGQCTKDLLMLEKYAPKWTPELAFKLNRVWHKWHLNDMRSACEHQRALGWTYANHPSAKCPVCGYKLGHAWLYEAVPEDVLEWLKALPETDQTPAWV